MFPTKLLCSNTHGAIFRFTSFLSPFRFPTAKSQTIQMQVPCAVVCCRQLSVESNNNQRTDSFSKSNEQSQEEQKTGEDKIKEGSKGIVAKLKDYFRNYWLYTLCVHSTCCFVWAGAIYLAVRSGVDVIGVLEFCYVPQTWIEKIKNCPPSAGLLAVTYIIYHIVTPIRYVVSLAMLRILFPLFKRFGLVDRAKVVIKGKINERRALSATRKGPKPENIDEKSCSP